jgi:hypothetical protein
MIRKMFFKMKVVSLETTEHGPAVGERDWAPSKGRTSGNLQGGGWGWKIY